MTLSCLLDAPAEAVWPELLDVERATAAVAAVRSCRIVTKNENVRLTAWCLLIRGSPLRWQQHETIYDNATSVSFRLDSGDPKRVRGEWRLRPAGAQAEADFALHFDFGLPRIAAVLDPVLTETLAAVLRGIAVNAERSAQQRSAGSSSAHPTDAAFME
jgi:coenzyme Q-binding protein COQ10